MLMQSADCARAPQIIATRELRRPHCPRCSAMVLMAENSRFDGEGRIDHAWSCEECGHTFRTTIRLVLR